MSIAKSVARRMMHIGGATRNRLTSLVLHKPMARTGKRGLISPTHLPGEHAELTNFYIKAVTHPFKRDLDVQYVCNHPLIDTKLATRLADFFLRNWSQFKNSYSLLNIGIGLNVPPNWLTFFRDALQYDCIASLEIWEPYIREWRHHAEFPVWQGDLRNIEQLLPAKSVDTILWAHGPEHLPPEEILPTYLKIKRVARHHILFVTPWGSAYDDQEQLNNNPFEKHFIKNPDVHIYAGTELNVLTWGMKGTPSAGMLAYEFLLER